MSSVSMLWLSICVALTQSQSNICVWNGISNANDPTYANPNGEYTLAGTTTDPKGRSHNYWKKSQSDCPQFIQALWWSNQKNYWCIWNTLSPDWEATSHPLLECDDSPIDNPLLCPSSWLDWTSTPNSIPSSMTLQSGSCPSLTCPAIQVRQSGLSACNKLFQRDLTKKNVFTYNSGSTTRYLYFNSNTFKWHCSDTLNLQSCDETASASVSSKTDGWTDVSVGSQFTVTLSNDKNAIFRCTTAAPTATPTLSPSRSPTPNPSQNPTPHPTKQSITNPSTPPTKQPTKTPTKKPTTQPPTAAPTCKPIHDPTQNPTHHPIVIADTIENTIQDVDSDVSTTANRGDTVRTSSGQDPILFVYVAASAIWFILIMTCVVAIVLCLKARKTNKSSAERRNTNGKESKDRGNSNHSVQHTNTTDVVSASNSDLDSSVSEQCVTIQIKTDDNPPANLIAPHAPNVRNEEVYSPEEALQGAEKETQEDEEHRADKETTTRGSVMHISDDVVPTDQGTDGNCVNEEQKEDVILDAMLSDILEMQNLDPNKIHQINLNNAVHQVNDNSDSDASDKIYQH